MIDAACRCAPAPAPAPRLPGRRVRLVLAALALAVGLTGCASLPSLEGRTESAAIPAEAGTRLHDSLGPVIAEHPGLTGIYPVNEGHGAFAARAALAAVAQRTLDVQYYIWHEDVSGKLMIEALRQAADRGVRVRLLLDDNNTKGMDPTLAALDAHPNVEIRLFNPFPAREHRIWGYATDFSRLNRRMHNKSFTADGIATIVGGRNIGDEYFAAGEGVGFLDLDVIAIGAAVAGVQASFDRYWSSASAYPVDRLLPPATPAQLERLVAQGLATAQSREAQEYIDVVRQTPVITDMVQQRLDWIWAKADLVVDDPKKGLGQAERKDFLMSSLEHVVGPPQSELALVSPYFVPMKEGVAAFTGMRQRGVRVRILTNALEATDVAAVHAGYAKRRKDLLKQGVELWELKRSAAGIPVTGPGEQKMFSGGSGSGSEGSSGSKGGASLHAKTFAVDRERIFVGSFNFDPRSAALNTEMGLVVHSPALASRVSDAFETTIPAAAYQVKLTPDGDLRWVERTAAGEVVHDVEPGSSGWKRFSVGFMSLFPIDWLL